MTETTRRGATAVRRALGALAGLVLLAVMSQPLWLAPLLERQLTGPERREVRIERASVGLTMALEPVLHLRGVRIANAPWADRSRPLVRAAEAVAVGSWRSLWAERRLVSLLVLRDAEIDLERQADGTRNWRLRDPDNRGPGRYRILALRAERSSLRLIHAGVDLELLASAAPNGDDVRIAGGPSLPVNYRFSGRWRGVGFTAHADAGNELTLYETARTFPLRGRLEAGGAGIDVEGRAGDILREQIVDLSVSAAGPSLAPFAPLLGPRSDERRGFRLEAKVEVAGHRYRLSDARGRFGSSDLSGSAGLRRDDNGRHAFDADLQSDRADGADLAWLLGRRDSDWRRLFATGAATSAAAAPAGTVPRASAPAASVPAATRSTEPTPFAALRGADVQLRYRAARLQVQRWPQLHSLAVQASLLGGKLTVASLDAGVAGGHLTGSAAVDASGALAQASADLAWQGLRVEQLLPAQKETRHLDGALRGKARLQAGGDSIAAMRAGLDGSLEATLTGGHIASRLDAELGLEGGKFLKSLLGGDERVPLRCVDLGLQAQRGKVRIERLAIESERTRTTGRGGIDLAAESVDVLLTPQPLQGGLFNLDRSIRLSGPWSRPGAALAGRGVDGIGDRCRL